MKPFDLLFQGGDGAPIEEREQLLDVLLLRLGGRIYGVAITEIVEIVRFQSPTIVPKTPASVLGIIGLRGHVLTVVDVRPRLGIEVGPPERSARIVVVRDAGGDLEGVYVDEVLRVVRVHLDQVEPPEQALGSEAKEHVRGVVRIDKGSFVFIHLAPLLV